MNDAEFVELVHAAIASAPKAAKVPPRTQESADVEYWLKRFQGAAPEHKVHCLRELNAARRRRGDFDAAIEAKREILDQAGERTD